MKEVWKNIENQNYYMVSNMGRVKSLRRWVRCNKGKRLISEKILSEVLSASGYPVVMINRKQFLVHRLVGQAFVSGFEKGLHINHKNGVRNDNREENLEWVTPKQNIVHAYKYLGRRGSNLGKFEGDHSCAKAVVRICKTTGQRKYYSAGVQAAKEGFDSGGISKACSGKWKTHKGYRWEYA